MIRSVKSVKLGSYHLLSSLFYHFHCKAGGLGAYNFAMPRVLVPIKHNSLQVCRDEYLFFDYRNPALIEQFLSDGTHQPIAILKSGLCREQYAMLRAQLLAAKEHGTITFGVDFRNFDFRDWYKDWTKPPLPHVERAGIRLQDIHPDPLVQFPVFKRDYNNDWDQWWLRYDKFARKGK
ncbi:hypothetical protein TELCIR_03434 [Teladorsagia circumcincta]|uniref:Uncharacterized protein n=1 Tax=Teladorsagia circumcincta TaxID=45464 RepID=A0A2G9UWM8_TELCI|nr:hypothetical protein TELCIR_03434 [Teladorsagia circumcincta]